MKQISSGGSSAPVFLLPKHIISRDMCSSLPRSAKTCATFFLLLNKLAQQESLLQTCCLSNKIDQKGRVLCSSYFPTFSLAVHLTLLPSLFTKSLQKGAVPASQQHQVARSSASTFHHFFYDLHFFSTVNFLRACPT